MYMTRVVVLVVSMLLAASAFRYSPLRTSKWTPEQKRPSSAIMMARPNDPHNLGNPRNWQEFVIYVGEIMFGAAFLIALHYGQISLPPANAEIDYFGIIYLGGGDKIDINNANIRAYLKCQGMYPGAAGKVATHGPYKTVSDVYAIPELTPQEKNAIKKCESRLIVLDPKQEYVIDRINNGLYR